MRFTRLALLPVAGLALAACTATTPAAPTTTATQAPASASVHTRVSAASQAPPSPVQPIKTPTSPPCTQVMTTGTGTETVANATFSVTAAVKNTGTSMCTIYGYPTVAITGLPPAVGDWPRKQLKVVQDGPADMVTLAPGGSAVVKLTFTPCQAGQDPTKGPVLLLGVPGDAGGGALTLEDGSDVVECGDVVKATAFKAHL